MATATKIGFKEIKAMTVALNKTGLLEKKVKVVGVKTEELTAGFIQAIGDVLDAGKGDDIPEEIYNLYEALPGEHVEEKETPDESTDTEDDDTEASDNDSQETEESCPSMGKDFDAKNKDCKQCKKDFLKDYKKCKEICEKTAKDKKDKAVKKSAGSPKSEYGHRLNTQGGQIDEMIKKGATFSSLIDMVTEDYGREENIAISGIARHCKHLGIDHEVTFEKDVIVNKKLDQKTKIKIAA